MTCCLRIVDRGASGEGSTRPGAMHVFVPQSISTCCSDQQGLLNHQDTRPASYRTIGIHHTSALRGLVAHDYRHLRGSRAGDTQPRCHQGQLERHTLWKMRGAAECMQLEVDNGDECMSFISPAAQKPAERPSSHVARSAAARRLIGRRRGENMWFRAPAA